MRLQIVRNAHFFRHRPHFDARRRPPSRSMRTGDFPRPPPRRSARTETPRPRIGANGAHSLAWCMSPLGHVAVRTALLAAGRRGRQPVPASRRGHRHRGAVTPPPRAPSPPRRGCRRPSRRSRARGRSAASCSHCRTRGSGGGTAAAAYQQAGSHTGGQNRGYLLFHTLFSFLPFGLVGDIIVLCPS